MIIQNLRIENLGFAYSGSEFVFQNLNAEFPSNKISLIVADFGRGRSTLMQILAGLLPVTEGHYFINSVPIEDMSFEEFLPYRLRIGYAFDLGGLLHNRTLLENLTLPLAYHKVCSLPEAEERAFESLRNFKIEKFANQRPSMVQPMVRKLVVLLRSLIHEPELLLLDDPGLGLTPDYTQIFYETITKLRSLGKIPHVILAAYDQEIFGLPDLVGFQFTSAGLVESGMSL